MFYLGLKFVLDSGPLKYLIYISFSLYGLLNYKLGHYILYQIWNYAPSNLVTVRLLTMVDLIYLQTILFVFLVYIDVIYGLIIIQYDLKVLAVKNQEII